MRKANDKNRSLGGDGIQPNFYASKVLACGFSMANICCSIEMEPRTLREGQLSHARVGDVSSSFTISFNLIRSYKSC